MILVYSVAVIVVVALLLRRDLGAIGRVSFRGGWKLSVAVLALFALQAVWVIDAPGQTRWQMAILILSQVALLLLLLVNYHLPGAIVFATGVALNTTVMVANGGWMPVTPETAHYVHPERPIELYSKPQASKNIILPRAETNLWILSDIIRIVLPWRRNAVSVGDILLIIGVAQFIFQTAPKKKHSLEMPQPLEKV
jgi:hypothetical protein